MLSLTWNRSGAKAESGSSGLSCRRLPATTQPPSKLDTLNLKKVIDSDRLHFHSDAEEYYIVLGGHMLIQIGNQNIEVSAGQVLLVRPGVPHLMLEVEPDTRILLVKAPAWPGDKHIVGSAQAL